MQAKGREVHRGSYIVPYIALQSHTFHQLFLPVSQCIEMKALLDPL